MLRKALLIVGGSTVGALLLLPALFGGRTVQDYIGGVAFLSLGLGLLLLFVGFVLVLAGIGAKQLMPYGQAFLIIGGLNFLLSFTLCTAGGALTGF